MENLSKAAFLCNACNKLLKEPKTLSCNHTFCKMCLQAHCLESATADSFDCPKCSVVVKVPDPNAPLLEWADIIPTNQRMGNSLEKLWRIEEEKKYFRCVFCLQKWKAVRAVKYCKSCAEYFCDECGNQHWLLRSSKEHRMWMIEDLEVLQKDPLVRARLELIFSAKYRGSRKKESRRPSLAENQTAVKKLSVDEKCEITGACFLSGQIVLADRGNNQLTLVDRHNVVQSVFKTPCYDIVPINQYFVVISCPHEYCLKIVSVYNHVMEEDRKISVDTECYGLCRIEDNFAVGLVGTPPCINIYSGSLLKEEIKLDHGKLSMKTPMYIAFQEKTEKFFVSDSGTSSMKSVSKSGRIVWEKKIDRCNGVSIFGTHLLIARSDRNTVDLVTEEGKILKSIVTSENGLNDIRVLSIDHWNDMEDGQRLVVVDAAELVHVFVLSDPMRDDDLMSYMDKGSGLKLKDNGEKDNDEDQKKNRSKTCIIL